LIQRLRRLPISIQPRLALAPPSFPATSAFALRSVHRLHPVTAGRILMLRSSTLSRIALLVILGMSASGCDAIAGIFKAGMWVGALSIIIVVVLVVFVVAKLRR
jgi:hypothetical protein